MGFRALPARWFEIVVPREDAHDTLEALARRGGVQFEWRGEHGVMTTPEALKESVARYRALARDYGRLWPEPLFEKRCCRLPIEISAKVSVRQLTRWRAAAGELLQQLERAERERLELDHWRPLLEALRITSVDLHALAEAGPVLAGFCLVLPASVDLPADPQALRIEVRTGNERALLGVLPREDLPRLRGEVLARGGEELALPASCIGTAQECSRAVPRLRSAVEDRVAHLVRELRALAQEYGVDRARGILERVDWFSRTAERIDCTGRYCWITGWTSEASPQDMNRALRDVGVRVAVEFTEPPRDALSPSVTRHPRWLRPFEVFTRAIGVPGIAEADPTTWVALLVPLMFGYMCGDVGHGAIIAMAGLLLRRWTPLWPLLVVCGAAAVGFGFAYGDLFGYDGIFEPLWLRPLDDPLIVLLSPVAGGALVLTVGLVLHAVQSCWRGEGAHRRVADMAQLIIYWGLLLTVFDPALGWLAAAGVLLCVVNRLWAERSSRALFIGLGQLAENSFTLLLNTLSFARVGAFALAHAALEGTILTLAADVDSLAGRALIVVVGNLLVVLLEGTVVMIQTTRLVLFEFFVRFFEGVGRPFLPASVPAPGQDSRESR